MNVPTNLKNDVILAALEAAGWNVTKAAADLRCNANSLRTSVIKRFPEQYAEKKADGSIRSGGCGWLRPGAERKNIGLPSDYTNEQILAVLDDAGWNITLAAAKLECHRESLRLAVAQRLPTEYAARKADGSIRAGFRPDAVRR